jgi:hypothetical protein
MRRSDLPRSLGTEFSVTQAVAAGVSRSRLRARDLEHPFHAVRSASGAPESGSAESRVLSRARQFPGIVALRGALPRVRTGASSRRETWLRLILVDAGLPEPDLDHDVFDADGQFVACLDLAYPKLKIGIEYDGDHHRTDPVQWARDVDRLDRLIEEGWRVVRATKQHIFRSSGVVVQRVRNAIAARRGV